MEDIKMLDDAQIEGQMSIYDLFEEQQPVSSLVAVSRVFARAIKTMNVYEWKAFVSTLRHIKWNSPNNKNVVVFSKMDLAKQIGIETDKAHVNRDLKKTIGRLSQHSYIEIDDQDKKNKGNEGWVSGTFVGVVDCSKKGICAIHLTPYYMPLFQELSKDNAYITLWADDIFGMSNERSILFYEDLRSHSDTNKINSKRYTTKELKILFNIPKDGNGSYMRKNGHFDRTAFEKKVIDTVCKDFEKCKMINLVINEEGKPYTKLKNSYGIVLGYEFTWTVSTHPQVASAKEVRELNQNPQELKIAKDIKNGEKKPQRNTFNNFEQNTYNFAELEDKLLDN